MLGLPVRLRKRAGVGLVATSLVVFVPACFPTVERPPRELPHATEPEDERESATNRPPTVTPQANEDESIALLKRTLRDPDALFAHLDRARRACSNAAVSRLLG